MSRRPSRTLRQDGVGLRAIDKTEEARARESGSRVAGHRVNHLPIAASHKYIGDLFVQGLAARHREQVVLTLGLRDRNERLVVEPVRVREDRPCDLDGIIVR